jgi:hypothetical protein
MLVGAHLSAQSPAAQSYSLTEVTSQTEASMFTGQPSTVKIYRSDTKELVELSIAPWSANSKGVHMSYLFDFAAHKAYTRDLDSNACSWMKYVSADAPANYDPITGSAQAMPKLAKALGGTLKVLGTESFNGIPAKVESISSPGAPDLFKAWVAEEGDFMMKFVGPAPGTGTPETTFEVKQLSFARPPASVFAAPTGCSETQGEWSDTGLNASASETVTVGTPSSQPSGAASGTSETSASKRIGAETGGSAGDFVSAVSNGTRYPPENGSATSCTALLRIVRGRTMTPVTEGFKLLLSLNPERSGTFRDVTPQFQNGILRIDNPPPLFGIQFDYGPSAVQVDIVRQCFRPQTVLLLVITNGQDFSQGVDFLWAKSGKYATIAASQATAATPAPANLVTNGDFESGNTGFTTGYTYGDVSGPAAYWIGKNASQAPGAYGDWYNGGDHTTGTGNMLVVDGANSATTPFWEEVVPVTPNTTYTFSYWGAEVDHDSNSLPHLQLKINGSSVGIKDIQEYSPDNGGRWENFTFTWNSGASSRADLALFDLNTDTPWNDFALDDISFGAHPSR